MVATPPPLVAPELMVATAPVATPVSAPPRPPPPWAALGYFAGYRVVLAALMLVLVFSGLAPRPLGHYDEALFRATGYSYALFATLAAIAALRHRPGFDLQVFVAALADIVAMVCFMHASGGVRSGFGLLLVVATAGASLLSRRRFAVLFAAIGSLAVLGQQVYSTWTDPLPVSSYPHAGMLGAALFATALLAHFSARRAHLSEVLAERRGIDLANLAELNQHIIARMQAGIVAVDGGGAVRLMNDSARALLGLGKARPRGQRLDAVCPDLAVRL